MLGIVMGLAAVAAAAQTDATETIVVTASRTRLEPRQIGSAVTVVTRDRIEAEQILLAKDVLQDVPGVQISNDRPGAVTSVYLRGADNDQVLVLLDGLKLGDPSNISTQYQFDHLSASEIERIEVLRGNQSSLYGSDAIGGVINVITRRPDADGVDVSLDAEGGSYGMRRLDAAVSGGSGILDYRFGVDSLAADGPSRADAIAGPADEQDAYDRLSLSARLGMQLTPDLRLETLAFTTDTKTELDGTGEDQTFLPFIEKDESSYAISLKHGGERWHNELSVNRYEAERFYVTSGDRFTGVKDNLRFTSSAEVSRLIAAAVGIDLEHEDTDQLTSFSGSFIARNDTDSLFAELALRPTDDITFTLAARRDDNRRFGEFDTHRVTAAWMLPLAGPSVKLRASVGTGAKAPGLYQLFDPSFGNTQLGVEQSSGFDLGADLVFSGGATLTLSYFANEIDDTIDFEFPSGFLNLGRTEASGVETDFSMPLSNRVGWSLSYTYLDARDAATGAWLGRPRNAATTRLTVDATDRLKLSARARYRSANAASFGGVTAGFVVVDLLGSYDLNDGIELYGRIVNLFDEDYEYEWGSSTYDLSAFVGIRLRY
jgi:vitamin B12 transporter